jgi:hypothetical protein
LSGLKIGEGVAFASESGKIEDREPSSIKMVIEDSNKQWPL